MTTTAQMSGLYDMFAADMTDDERYEAARYAEHVGGVPDMFVGIQDEEWLDSFLTDTELSGLAGVLRAFELHRSMVAEWLMHAQDLASSPNQSTPFREYAESELAHATLAARVLAQHALAYLTGESRIIISQVGLGETG